MKNTKYTIVKYRPEYRDQVVELQKYLWSPSTTLNSEYFEWKYERNPYLDSPLIFLALYEGKVVAMRGMFGARWEVGSPSNTVLGLCTEDLVVAPEHRKRGLMTLIMKYTFHELAKGEYSHIFSLSAAAVTMIASLAMGWRNVGSGKPMRRQPGKAPFLFRLQRNIRGRHLVRQYSHHRFPIRQWVERQRPFIYLDRKRLHRGWEVNPRISVQNEPRPEAMAELVKQIGCDGRIRHVRDSTYFSWRFQNPLSRYRFLFWDEDGLKGYLVLQEYVTPYLSKTRVNIVDWEAVNSHVSSELLRAAVRCCGLFDMEIWSATLDNEKKMFLSDAEFHPVDESKGMAQHQICLLVRPIREDIRDTDWEIAKVSLLDMGNWDMRMIFSTMG
jgi:GNAT superfamily N-acetyltransferase